jgi:hypothetical protein
LVSLWQQRQQRQQQRTPSKGYTERQTKPTKIDRGSSYAKRQQQHRQPQQKAKKMQMGMSI